MQLGINDPVEGTHYSTRSWSGGHLCVVAGDLSSVPLTGFESMRFGPNSGDQIFLLHTDELTGPAKSARLVPESVIVFTNPLTNGHVKLGHELKFCPGASCSVSSPRRSACPRHSDAGCSFRWGSIAHETGLDAHSVGVTAAVAPGTPDSGGGWHHSCAAYNVGDGSTQ